MKILALDLGKFKTMCCFFDTKTRGYSFLLAATERNYLKTVFEMHSIDLLVMEVWKWSNVKRKTDKDDALKLARMAALGELKAVYMPSHQHREFRSLVKHSKVHVALKNVRPNGR